MTFNDNIDEMNQFIDENAENFDFREQARNRITEQYLQELGVDNILENSKYSKEQINLGVYNLEQYDNVDEIYALEMLREYNKETEQVEPPIL